ncbi:hypothetical protein [Desulforhopalus sp. IMCC35007]|uniref:hypothetical protein n=1 Tax=Desulforhopalus sp. IMCC35007 TaxID=2569543 RepID=UPI0010AEA487|nr:hypothetical protein [Desulforhopalus sp. IMCC35007]TKB07333.1 hypothetical protein FCL48_17840 [Desulforhopalus sp. IMCC35007]
MTILQEILPACIAEFGGDLVLDNEESYISDFCHDEQMILWVFILDRLSTDRDEMWGDISFSRTGPDTMEYTEVRWYDPHTQTKHIVCNAKHVFCLTTNVPLAYNTIF